MNLKDMQGQWEEFCKKNNVQNPLQYFEKIKNQHQTPPRHYHTFEGHIAQGLQVFAEFRRLCENPDLVYFSWVNHDSIYNPKSKDNEEKSAGFAYHLAIKMGLGGKFASSSNRLILITKHIKKPKTTDEKIIADIDLSIFGQSPSLFDKYEENIRKEYYFCPPEIYKPGRVKILKGFLDRNPLYQIPEIKEKYEATAKENLKRSIENLKLY